MKFSCNQQTLTKALNIDHFKVAEISESMTLPQEREFRRRREPLLRKIISKK